MEIERWPGELDAAVSELAGRARVVAAELVVVAAGVRGCGGLTWQGRAARRFEDEVAERAAALVALEGELSEIARTLDSVGQDAEHRLRLVLAHDPVVGMLP